MLSLIFDDGNRQVISVATGTSNLSDISDKYVGRNTDFSMSPIRLFRKTSESMSRHAIKWLGQCPSPNVYRSSDNGRRVKVPDMSVFGRCGWSDDESEYESPDEDWFYDPRNKSKWTWENDYCSLASNSTGSSSPIFENSNNSKCYHCVFIEFGMTA